MRPPKDPDPHAPKDVDHGMILCYVCETDVTERPTKKEIKKDGEREKEKEKIRPGLVEITSEGTGFAGGGSNMAKREGVAFQC